MSRAWSTSAVVTALLALGSTGLARTAFSALAVLCLVMLALEERKGQR